MQKLEFTKLINGSLPQLEENVVKYWRNINAFETLLKKTKDNQKFIFYDGPPYANHNPHYGHILVSTIKDIICRYASMNGYHVERQVGWDCHGLPIEYEIEKRLGIKQREDILQIGIKKYNEECRSIVMRCVDNWTSIYQRIGRWTDFKKSYKTMDKSYMESVWWVFKEMYQKGLIYRDFKVMPYSTALTTQLSNFEKGLNYQNRRDPAIIVKFVVIPNNRLWLLIITHWFRVFNLLEKAPNEIFDLILVFSAEKNTFFLAWTYQPWTLLGNLALCVNKNLTYVKFQDETGNYYYCGKNALNKRKKQNAIIKGRKNFKFTVIEEYNGSQLVGMKYEPLFSYFSSRKHCFCVVDDDFVSETEGTGIFPLAPAHGEDDFRVCQNVGIYKKGRDKIQWKSK
eukprot:36326_1